MKLYMSLMVTDQKPVTDKKLRKEHKYNTKENHQVTREEGKKGPESYKNN